MTAGKRNIQAVKLTADLPTQAVEGDMCWNEETASFVSWGSGGWQVFPSTDPAEILNVMTYDYDKQSDILNIPETYTVLNSYTSPARPAGVYEYGMSITWDFSTGAKSAYIRFSTNGGVSWNEFISEPKDVQDRNATYYQFPLVHAGGTMSLDVQGRKEDAVGVFNVTFSDCWMRRVA